MAIQVDRAFLFLQLLLCPTFLLTENVALEKKAIQHGTSNYNYATYAVDGDRNQDSTKGGCAISNSLDPTVHTLGTSPLPAWWAVDLGSSSTDNRLFFIQSVTIYTGLGPLKDSIKSSIIKAGSTSDMAAQTECAKITEVADVIYKQCNPIEKVRYLSIITSSASSLLLCEVEVEGYSVTVFRKVFSAPMVKEIGPSSVVLQITPPPLHLGFFQILYTALSGNLHEQYGIRTRNRNVELHNLSPGIQYEIRILTLEGSKEIAKAISYETIVTMPELAALPRVPLRPTVLSIGHTAVTISFFGDSKANTYLIQAVQGRITVHSKTISSVANKIEYTVSLTSLQEQAWYNITVTPFTSLDGVKIRGFASPHLTLLTSQAQQPPLPSHPTMGPVVITPKPVSVMITTEPPTTSVPKQPTSEPIATAASVVQVTKDWVVPVAGGVAGGAVLLLALIFLICYVCHTRKKDKGGKDLNVRRSHLSNNYESQDHPQPTNLYANTLPDTTETGSMGSDKMDGSTTESGRLSRPTLPSRENRPPAPPHSDPPTDEEDELHADIDDIYAKINKGPDILEGH